ncbi:MAG: ShlB/FhaC/HecB family hemolysin secretion/activation protein, partial [Rhabdochlamydiaceae bacterium]
STLLQTSFLVAASQSPPIPPAGVVDRQIEQEYEVQQIEPTKEVPLLEFDLPTEELDVGDEKVTIHSIEVSGNTVIHGRVLKRILKTYLERPLSMKELREMCLVVQSKYIRKGYFLTRAYLPPQEIREGVLKIEVIEGRLGGVSVVGNKFYSTKFISGYFDKYQNKPIQYDKILRTLFLIDENSDLEVGAVFKKGEQFGTADLILRVSDKRPIHLAQDTNNYGSDHTTHQRTGTRLDYGNLVMYGDTLTLIEVVGSPVSHLNFTDVIYHAPINTMGTSLDISYLCANFKTDKVDHIRYVGRSHVGGAKLNQALHRTRFMSTDFFSSFDVKQVQNFGGGKRTSFDKLRVLTGGMLIDYIDGWKGRNLFNFSIGWGIPVIFGGSSAKSDDSSRLGSGGQFIKGNLGWKRLQELPYNCFLLFNAVGQFSFDKLPLPEEIYIGGIDTVRGYPLAEGISDCGYYGTVEFHIPPPFLRAHLIPWSKKKTWGEFLQFIAFLDMGQTFSLGTDILREENEGSDHTKLDGRVMLMSVGPGIRLHGPWKLEWSFDVGFPLTERHRSSNTIIYFRVACNIL